MLHIRVTSENGSLPEKSMRLGQGELRIGRDASNDLVVDDASVSRFHCKLVRSSEGKWELFDLSSRNGLFHEGEKKPSVRIAGTSPVRVLLGEVEIEITASTDDEDATKSVDVSLLRKKSARALDRGTWRKIAIAMLAALAVAVGDQALEEFTQKDPSNLGRFFTMSLVNFSVAFLFVCFFALIAKVTRHDYRFARFFRVVFLGYAALEVAGLVLHILLPLLPDANAQEIANLLLQGPIFIAVFSFSLVEAFPKLNRTGAAVALLLLGFGILNMGHLKKMVAHNYEAAADSPPQLGHPYFGIPKSGGVEDLLKVLAERKKEIDGERASLLKLR
jgi:FHA domain